MALMTTLVACRGGSSQSAPDAGPASTSSVTVVTSGARIDTNDASVKESPPATKATAGETISVPSGGLVAGSLPGDEGRDPTVEPVALDVPMSAFVMDALPYPNDPKAPFTMTASRDEAAKLCA